MLAFRAKKLSASMEQLVSGCTVVDAGTIQSPDSINEEKVHDLITQMEKVSMTFKGSLINERFSETNVPFSHQYSPRPGSSQC